MKKLIIRSAGVLAAIIAVTYLFLVWHNNRTIPDATVRDYSASFEKSMRWLSAHRAEVLAENNSMLWWMIMKSAGLTDDQRLHKLFEDYRQRYLTGKTGNVWRGLFESAQPLQILYPDISHLPDYNIFFIYGLTCSANLKGEEIIRRQMEVTFCREHHPISPACTTHQLMGVLFAKQNQCEEHARLDSLVTQLQEKLVSELTWDPRVVDVYIQRVLMLVESGTRQQVKPAWIRNVLDAQREDGGWSGFQPVIPMGGNRYAGFTSKGLGIRLAESDFHATAQGILLISLLAKSQPDAGR